MSDARVLVCNAGTLHLFHLAEELMQHGLLHRCATSLYFAPEAFDRLPAGLRARAEARTANRRCAALAGKVRTRAVPELAHLLAARLLPESAPRWIAWRNASFARWAGRHCLDGVDLVWSFDTSSLELFEAARARGLRCVLDVSTPHPAAAAQIMQALARQRPQYVPGAAYGPAQAELTRREREMALADCLVVASAFAARSLAQQGIAADRIRVNPYGVDLDAFGATCQSTRRGRQTVFLFVGWFSPHKGVYHLLEAWDRARLAETGAVLRMAGGAREDLPRWTAALPPGVELLGRVSHRAMPEVLAAADAFVFPTLLDGFGLVILEAMAAGLPVVTTRNCAGPDLLVEGESGIFTEAGNVDALVEALHLLASDPALRQRMGEAARRRVSKMSWQAYGGRCAAICRELLQPT